MRTQSLFIAIYGSHFNCTMVVKASLIDSPQADIKLLSVGWCLMRVFA